MAFINSEIDIKTLPAFEQMKLIPIQPLYHKLLRLEWLISSAFLFILATALIIFVPSFHKSPAWQVIALSTIAIIGLYYLLQEKAFLYKAYAVREHDVAYQHGWLIRTLKIAPYNRIQNCSIQTSVLERKYGLASLTLYTAGATGADIRIPGLLHDEAEYLRQFILNKMNAERV